MSEVITLEDARRGAEDVRFLIQTAAEHFSFPEGVEAILPRLHQELQRKDPIEADYVVGCLKLGVLRVKRGLPPAPAMEAIERAILHGDAAALLE